MSLLITSSLIDSVAWAKTAPDSQCRDDPSMSWKQKAYSDLKNTLARIWTPGNKAVERGMRVENAVYKVISDKKVDTVKCSPLFKQVLDKCNGGVFQKKTKKFLEIDGKEYCLFGKIDVYFPDKIIDLKTTTEYKGRSKYLGNIQHKLYVLNERIPRFEYVIMEFGTEDSDIIQNVHTVEYVQEDFEALKAEVVQAIKDTMSFIDQFDEPGDLKDLYLHKFNMYN